MNPPTSRSWYWMLVVPHLLVLGALIALAIGFWHQHKMDVLRERYSQRYGAIDIPEALYFDGMAADVRVPVLFVWLGLQITSAVLFCLNWRTVTVWGGLAFVALWALSWLGVVQLTFHVMFG